MVSLRYVVCCLMVSDEAMCITSIRLQIKASQYCISEQGCGQHLVPVACISIGCLILVDSTGIKIEVVKFLCQLAVPPKTYLICKFLRFRSVWLNVGHPIVLCNGRKSRQARDAQLRRRGKVLGLNTTAIDFWGVPLPSSGYFILNSSSIDNEALILSA
jgi:hypothetical protein